MNKIMTEDKRLMLLLRTFTANYFASTLNQILF